MTLLYDEIDTVFGPKARENEELRGLLNAGHRKGAVAGRCVVRGKNIETEEIPAYAAVAMAGLGWLPDTILSRSVIVRMRRRHAGERVEPYRRRVHAGEGRGIREMIAAWTRSVSVEWPELPNEIQDRDADVWEPLVAVADAIGGEWPARARAAGVALVADSKEVEASLGIRLLTDLQSIFEGAQELPSKAILELLQGLPEAPWGDLHGKPLDERGLARRLRAYGIKPKTIRTDAGTPRGYSRTDLEDQWRRYNHPTSPKQAKQLKHCPTRLFRMLWLFWSSPRRRAMPLSEVTNAITAASSATLCSATTDWPPLGSIANVRTTGARNMTSAEMGSRFRDSWTDEMFSSAGDRYCRTHRIRLIYFINLTRHYQ